MKKSLTNWCIIVAVWLCFTGCKTSHTISRAELHRTTERVVKTDSLATHHAITDSTFHNTTVTDSIVVTQIIETIITNTVDTAGNILSTNRETNRTTNRDRNRIVNNQTSSKHNEQTETDSNETLYNIIEKIDSTDNEDITLERPITVDWTSYILDALLNSLYLLAVVCAIYILVTLIYKYITGK